MRSTPKGENGGGDELDPTQTLPPPDQETTPPTHFDTATTMSREDKNDKHKKDAKNVPKEEEKSTEESYLGGLSRWVTAGMEDAFENYGRLVASHTLLAATLCLALTALCAVGSLWFSTELRPYRLWIPQDSEFIKVLDWQTKNFPNSYRQHMVVWEGENILTAPAIRQMWHLHNSVSQFTVGDSKASWTKVCARVPSLPVNSDEPQEYDYEDFDYGSLRRRRRRRRRNTFKADKEDLSLLLPRDMYCDNLATLPRLCLETSLLEIWGYNEDVIMSLTDDKILEDINKATLSEVFGYKVNFTSYLGSITYDEAGNVMGAQAATHVWFSLVNKNAVDQGDYVVDQGSGQLVDTVGFAWEEAWVETVLNDTSRPDDIRVYARAASSFGSVSDSNIWGDVKWLTIGFALMSMFVNATLGRRNLVEQRPMLAFLGMASVGQAVAISYGLCSFLSVPYCPINSILPMLLIGLGVDDMFVIMSAWDAAGPGDLVERAGRTMRHAGVAITVTSLTDVTAFAVGASTELPALKSFCLYAAVGIFAVYVMQATFFMAWLVRDQQRLEEKKNGLCWFYTHRDWSPSACSQIDLMKVAFKKYICPFILSTPVRVFILFGSGCLVASSIWCTSNLRQEFNPMWFIPSSSYLYKAFSASKKHFPDAGERGYVYFSNVTFPDDLPVLTKFTTTLTESNVITAVDAWFTSFEEYMTLMPAVDNSTVQDILSIFLQSSSGASYRGDVTVNGKLDCYKPAPTITSFRIGITHRPAESPADQAAALTTIKELVQDVPLQGYKAAWAQAYSIWETNEVVGYELWRNIILASIVVFVVTLVLLASLSAALLVMACVAATVVGVAGTMWIWGLTVDTVSCIALVLSIGLSVDYAAHIAHGFLAARGLPSRKARAHAALESAGCAVLQGGLSTLLSFILLASSSSHVFLTFFKVFTAASILGLYYGLIFLPVVLSIMGPKPYTETEPSDSYQSNPPSHPEVYTNSAFTPDHQTTKDDELV